MSDLVVRVYNVRFGDAIFITIPDTQNGQSVERTILIDFGNALGTEGGRNDVMGPVIDDISTRLGGRPLDLFVMTHEHLDHAQGFLFASTLGKHIAVKQAWLTASADPTYKVRFPNAEKEKIAALRLYRQVRANLAALAVQPPLVAGLLAANDPQRTKDCVDFLRTQLTTAADVHFVDRTTDLSQLWQSSTATITLWAPEADTSDYYGRFKPHASGLRLDDFDDLGGPLDEAAEAEAEAQVPPRGVDAGAFYNLLDVRHEDASSLLAIDKAANNTSIVMLLEWHGWKLLFPGDAERRSWREMDKQGLVEPVHFLKVSHHGSSNGLPPDAILDKLLPLPAPAGRKRSAAVSTFENTYPGLPDGPTLQAVAARAELHSTLDDPNQLSVAITFPEMP